MLHVARPKIEWRRHGNEIGKRGNQPLQYVMSLLCYVMLCNILCRCPIVQTQYRSDRVLRIKKTNTCMSE